MKSLVKYFGLILLIVFTNVWTSNGEDIELQDAMPQEILANSVNHSEYSTAGKTIKYLCLEHIAIPFSAVIELPGNHPHSSKSKTLQTNIQNNRHIWSLNYSILNHYTPIPYHVIDYYIYTLEHILI